MTEFIVKGTAWEDGKVYYVWRMIHQEEKTQGDLEEEWDECLAKAKEAHPDQDSLSGEWNVTDVVEFMNAKGWVIDTLDTVEVTY